MFFLHNSNWDSEEGNVVLISWPELQIGFKQSWKLHHVIIIFGTCVKWWYLHAFFSFFKNFVFLCCAVGGWGIGGWVGGGVGKKWKITIISVKCHITGTVKHMIMIFGKLVLNDISRSFFNFSKKFDFLGC